MVCDFFFDIQVMTLALIHMEPRVIYFENKGWPVVMLLRYLSTHITLTVTVHVFDINQRHTVSHWHQ